MEKILFLILFLFISSSTVQAALGNVYFAQTAQGLDTGADCADAMAMSFVTTKNDWGTGSSQLGAGSTIHLCGTITSSIYTYAGGASASSPLTIKFEPGAVMSSPAWNKSAISSDGQSYITIDGGTTSTGAPNGTIENTANGLDLANQIVSWLVYLTGNGTQSNLTVKNLNIINVFVNDPANPVNTKGQVTKISIANGGSGYAVGDVLAIVQSGASGATAQVTAVNSSGAITGISVDTLGTLYPVSNGLSTTGGTGTGATVNVTANSPNSYLTNAIIMSGSNLLVTNNYITNTGGGIEIQGGNYSNITVSNNTIQNIDHGIEFGFSVSGTVMSNITISGNSLSGFTAWDNNVNYHRDGIFLFDTTSDHSGSYNNTQIYNNTIFTGFNPITNAAGTDAIYLQATYFGQFQGLYIFNNVFSTIASVYWGDGVINAAGTGTLIANNTIVSWVGESESVGANRLGAGGENSFAYNNIVEYPTEGAIAVAIEDSSGLGDQQSTDFSDYNLFYNLPSINPFVTVSATTPDLYCPSLATWSNVITGGCSLGTNGPGWDGHSLVTNPLLVNDNTSSTTADYHLTAASPAIKAGINLTSYCSAVPALCYDHDGNLRPAKSAWDIGAYQYSSSSTVPYGDVNGSTSGQVTVYDAELVAQAVVGLIALTPTQQQAAMVSSSTETQPTIYDAYLIAEYAVGKITKFPVQQ